MLKILKFLSEQSPALWLLSLICLAFFLTLSLNIFMPQDGIFTELAWSFIHGHLDFINPVNNVDLVPFNNLIYWHMPPLPAIFLMPLVFIWQTATQQVLLNIILNLLSFLLIARLARKNFNLSKLNAYWLATFYIFATVNINCLLLPWAYQLAHSLATLLILASLYEFFNKRRYWFIGSCLGLIFLTRLTAGLVIIFFILIILLNRETSYLKLKKLLQLSLPVFLCLILLAGYNYCRFDNPFNSGYLLTNSYQDTQLHASGQFSLHYLPTNLYYYLMESVSPYYAYEPQAIIHYNHHLTFPYFIPSRTGCLSFFLICPLFLLLFKADYKNKINRYLLATALIILFVLLCYYYNGRPQIGPRYANDFLPLLLIILLSYFQKHEFKFRHQLIVTFSILLNIFLGSLLVYQIANLI